MKLFSRIHPQDVLNSFKLYSSSKRLSSLCVVDTETDTALCPRHWREKRTPSAAGSVGRGSVRSWPRSGSNSLQLPRAPRAHSPTPRTALSQGGGPPRPQAEARPAVRAPPSGTNSPHRCDLQPPGALGHYTPAALFSFLLFTGQFPHLGNTFPTQPQGISFSESRSRKGGKHCGCAALLSAEVTREAAKRRPSRPRPRRRASPALPRPAAATGANWRGGHSLQYCPHVPANSTSLTAAMAIVSAPPFPHKLYFHLSKWNKIKARGPTASLPAGTIL